MLEESLVTARNDLREQIKAELQAEMAALRAALCHAIDERHIAVELLRGLVMACPEWVGDCGVYECPRCGGLMSEHQAGCQLAHALQAAREFLEVKP